MRILVKGRHGMLLAVALGSLTACTPGDRSGAEGPPASPTTTQRASPVAAETRSPSARPVVAETLPYGEVDNELVYGHFAIPADMIDPLPAIIVIHDWWGLNQEMRDIAEQLAAEGYIVLGVDLFRGQTAKALGKARELETEVVENPTLAVDNLRQAVDFIRNTAGAPRVATVGFGFGGGWSLNAAIEMPGELDASVSYYGQVVSDRDKLTPVTAPILGLYAEGDRAVPADSVREFQSTMDALEKDVDIQMYGDARRGFADRLSDNYDADVAAEAWNHVLQFLDTHVNKTAD